MPGNVPQTKTSELIGAINALDENNVNGFELARIKREAVKLASSDAQASYVIQGIIASFEGDIDEMRRLHENAIKLCRDSFSLGNYATSLVKAGLDKDGLVMAEEAYKLLHGDLKIIDQLIRYNFRCGKIDKATHWFEQWKKEKPGERMLDYEKLMSGAAFLNEKEISSEDVEKLVEAAIEVLHENEVFKYDLGHSLVTCEGGTFSWILSLQLTVDEVTELTMKLTDKILSLPDQMPALEYIDLRYESALT